MNGTLPSPATACAWSARRSRTLDLGGRRQDAATLFGDVATELLIRSDGDEGLFVAYDRSSSGAGARRMTTSRRRAPLPAGYKTRTMTFEARGVITTPISPASPSACDVLDPPVVCRASGTCVVLAECQRGALSQAR